MVDAVTAAKESNKETSGKFAMIVWVVSGIYLFATTPHASFFSWQAAVFFILGMFAAAIVLGGFFYLIMTALTGIFARLAGRSSLAPSAAALISLTGILLFVGNIVVSYLSARWAFNALIG